MEQIKQPVPKEHHIREECGVFGVFSRATSDVASLAYYGLFALQHRGQESAGIAVNDDGVFTAYCDEGLVNEVFPKERIKQLGTGNIVVGHVRYAISAWSTCCRSRMGARASAPPALGAHTPLRSRDGAIRTGLNEKSGKGSRPRRETYERLCRGRERLERSEDGT